jgi:hypothetical protein
MASVYISRSWISSKHQQVNVLKFFVYNKANVYHF